jgi:hypothetical protein
MAPGKACPGLKPRPTTAWTSSWARSATGTRSAAAATTPAPTRRRAATATPWISGPHAQTGASGLHEASWPRPRSRACLWPGAGRDQETDRARLERTEDPDRLQEPRPAHPHHGRAGQAARYSPRVGAMQANFGTPFENGIADLQDQLAEARAAGNQAEVERLEAKLDAAVAAAKPGKGPDDSWATTDLDVNDDRTVDARDLEAAIFLSAQ